MADLDFGDDDVAEMDAAIQRQASGGSVPRRSSNYYGLDEPVSLNAGLSSLARRPKRRSDDLDLSDLDDRADDEGDRPSPKSSRGEGQKKKKQKNKDKEKKKKKKKKQKKEPKIVEPRLNSVVPGDGGEERVFVGTEALPNPEPPAKKKKKKHRKDSSSSSSHGYEEEGGDEDRRRAQEAKRASRIDNSDWHGGDVGGGEDDDGSQALVEDVEDSSDDSDDSSSSDEEDKTPPAPKIKFHYVRRRKCRAPDYEMARDQFGRDPKPPYECVGCTHLREDVAKPGWEKLQQMGKLFNTKMGNGDIITLAKAMALYYAENIRAKANAPGAIQPGETPLPEWDAPTIYEHYTHHVNEFGVRRLNRLQLMDNIIRQLYVEEAWREVETAPGSYEFRKQLDQVALARLERWLKLEAQLYGQDARRAMFSSAGIGMPNDDIQAIMKVNKARVSVRNAARITGTSNASQGSNAGVGGTIQGAGAGGGGAKSGFAAAARPRSSNWT